MNTLQTWARIAGGEVAGPGYILAPGPGHSPRDRSLKIWPGPDGLARVHSFAADTWQECKDHLRGLGLPVGGLDQGRQDRPQRRQPPPPPPPPPEPHHGALKIWRGAERDHPLLRAYLQHRGISLDPPPSLRLHPKLGYRETSGPGAPDHYFPALIGGVQLPDRRLVAVQRTFLAADGMGKAPVGSPKKGLGACGAGAIRLAPAAPVLGLVEGTEDGLSVMEMTGIGCWASLGARRFSAVEFPAEVREIHIYAQNDPNGTSQEEADKAAVKFKRQGRRVIIHLPAFDLKDWNDALQSERRGYS